MPGSRRRAWKAVQTQGPWALGLLATLAIVSGCESAPVRAFQGARHYSTGTDALNQGQATRAIEELELAAALVPKASEIQNHLGLAYWSAGRVADARVAFERAIELDCDNQAARANLDRLMDASNARADSGLDSDRSSDSSLDWSSEWKGERDGG